MVEGELQPLLAEAEAKRVHVWPQHWHAWQVFLSMGTQWRMVPGTNGPVYLGLDYAALPHVKAEVRMPRRFRRSRRELMRQLRVLEARALAAHRKT